MVIESLRCGGTLDGQLRKTAPVMEEVFNSVQALRGVPAEMGDGRRRYFAGCSREETSSLDLAIPSLSR